MESLSQEHLLRMHTFFIDRSPISGTESGHITRQMFHQEIISAHESKSRASKNNLSSPRRNNVFVTFKKCLEVSFSAGSRAGSIPSLHVKFDSYLELLKVGKG